MHSRSVTLILRRHHDGRCRGHLHHVPLLLGDLAYGMVYDLDNQIADGGGLRLRGSLIVLISVSVILFAAAAAVDVVVLDHFFLGRNFGAGSRLLGLGEGGRRGLVYLRKSDSGRVQTGSLRRSLRLQRSDARIDSSAVLGAANIIIFTHFLSRLS